MYVCIYRSICTSHKHTNELFLLAGGAATALALLHYGLYVYACEASAKRVSLPLPLPLVLGGDLLNLSACTNCFNYYFSVNINISKYSTNHFIFFFFSKFFLIFSIGVSAFLFGAHLMLRVNEILCVDSNSLWL